jgi:hypothetical protein
MLQDLSPFKSNYKFGLGLHSNDMTRCSTFTEIGHSFKNLLRTEIKTRTPKIFVVVRAVLI